jgi:exopolyphosphatase/guanosine-5'-triphosphate,3'-diphosphate pyrophosphatase
MLDIGGGSLEIGAGLDESPDVAISLPLGAGRLTLDRLPGDPPSPDAIRAARRYIRAEIARVVPDVKRAGAADQTVGSSKTFRSLARICGAASSDLGDYVPRLLRQRDLAVWVPKLAAMTATQRAGLHGVSVGRSAQLLAGALVAEAAMELLGVEQLQVCPWALREGMILRRLDLIATGNGA